MFSELIIYCFSGTGNSLLAAQWMSKSAKIKSKIVMIEKNRAVKAGSGTLVGFVYPTHGLCAPWNVLKFALSMPRCKGASAFCAPTRGMARTGFFLPGAQLSAASIIALILRIKGYSIAGMTGIDMPQNWTMMFWGLKRSNVDIILSRSKKKTEEFISAILKGKKNTFSPSNCVHSFLGLIFFPVSVAYMTIGRFFLTKTYVPGYACNGCSVCAKNCPVGAIKMSGGGTKTPRWSYACESCMRCMNYCPKRAIESASLLWVAYLLLAAIPFYTTAGRGMTGYFTGMIGLYPLKFILFILYFLMIAVLYRALMSVMRFKAVRAVFTYTSISHYFRRYSAPGIPLSAFRK